MSKEQETPEDMRCFQELRAEIKKGLDSGPTSLWDPEEIKAAGRALRAERRKSVCDPSPHEWAETPHRARGRKAPGGH